MTRFVKKREKKAAKKSSGLRKEGRVKLRSQTYFRSKGLFITTREGVLEGGGGEKNIAIAGVS